MKCFILIALVCAFLPYITCPPVKPDQQKPTEAKADEIETGRDSYERSYQRYLDEVGRALEEDEGFKATVLNMTQEQITNGDIAHHLEFVNHRVRTKLDEIKRREVARLKELVKAQMEVNKGVPLKDVLDHLDHKNTETFEVHDLKKLIKKATYDLEELDKKRKENFKEYEMEKEHERREKLKHMTPEERKKEEEHEKEMKKKHEDHPKVHEPGSKAQLEEVWEKEDHMDPKDFDPKTFFKLHDINGDGYLDTEELEGLMQTELDKVYNKENAEDDMVERDEEMNRMREHIMNEIDKDKDGLVSFDEFMNTSKDPEINKDEGWKDLDQEQEFNEKDFEEYEKSHHPDALKDLDAQKLAAGDVKEMHAGDPVPMAHTKEQEAKTHEKAAEKKEQH